MRWVLGVLLALGLAPTAFADDFDVLRGSVPVGPPTFTRWSGFYIGGRVGLSAATADFSKSTSAPIAFVLRETQLENQFAPSEWPVLGKATQSGAINVGGFAGYNSQWQDLVLGIEADFNHTDLSLDAPSAPISRITPPDAGGNTNQVDLSATGKMTNVDYMSLRGRAGYVMGNFMPYGFAGLAIGTADIAINANLTVVQNPPTNGGACLVTNTPPCQAFFFTAQAGRTNTVLYGFVAGFGTDVLLTPNAFLRGEIEFTQFSPNSGVLLSIASAHLGAGLKF